MSFLRISHTGVRDGELIISAPSAKQNAGTQMMIRGFYPPSRPWIDKMDNIEIRDVLNIYPFFQSMNVEERKSWLIENSIDNDDLYLQDCDIKVKILKIGGKFMIDSLGEDTIDILVRGNPEDPEGYWPIQKVYKMFPRKPGSRAARHTLIFRPNNWVLSPQSSSINTYTGMYINLEDGIIRTGTVTKDNKKNNKEKKVSGEEIVSYLKIIQLQHPKIKLNPIAMVTKTTRSHAITIEDCKKLAISVLLSDVEKDESKTWDDILSLIDWFSPALHKSLIQKIIRTKCSIVEHNHIQYDAKVVLLCSISLLLCHSGAFVPTIQRFVRGLESASKRLAVAICEDSYLEDMNTLLSLYSCAIVSQQDSQWQPTDIIIKYWFRAAIEAQSESRLFDYNWHDTSLKDLEINPAYLSYLLLYNIKSFESDISMVLSIAQRNGKARKLKTAELKANKFNAFEVMPLFHCIDHHTYTDIGWYVSPELLVDRSKTDLSTTDKSKDSGKPYSGLFQTIWNQVVGYNPRSIKYNNWSKNHTVYLIQEAQRLVWDAKTVSDKPGKINKKSLSTLGKRMIKFKYRLDVGWLAGLIGPIEIKVGINTILVVLRVDNIDILTAIQKPSRDKREISEEDKELAIVKAKNILKGGYKLSLVPSTIPMFIDAIVYWNENDGYTLKLKDDTINNWIDLCQLSYEFAIHESIELTINNAIHYTGDSIMDKARIIFQKIIEEIPLQVLRRLATYLEGNHTTINLHKISRDGSGVDYAVLTSDTDVFRILCQICLLYPAGLVKSDNGFEVKCGPIIWNLRDRILKVLRTRSSVDISTDSKYIKAKKIKKWTMGKSDPRPLWDHQRESIQAMIRKHKSGGRGHEIWLEPGYGKTEIVIGYIKYLIQHNQMPPYCIYTLPPSAVNSVQKELDLHQIPHCLIDMRLSNKKNRDNKDKLQPHQINLVWHDHMRLNGLDEQMKTVGPDMFFIVDEFHKCLAKTQRTSIALEILRLSRDFVGMSGTLIRNTEVDELIPWLEQIVPFDVTVKNFYVAVGALISRKVVTHVVVDREMIEVDVIDPELYRSLVPPSIGGTSDKIDFKPALNLCWKSTDLEKIRQTIHYVGQGEIVFLLGRDVENQKYLHGQLIKAGIKHIHMITKDNPITLLPGKTKYKGNPIQVVITTPKHVEGYTLVGSRILIQDVFFGNQATRDQLEGRINRLNQPSDIVYNVTIHCGILSYILRRYESARSLSEALKGFALDLGLEDKQLLSY